MYSFILMILRVIKLEINHSATLVSCYVCASFAVNTCTKPILIKYESADVLRIPTRGATDGTTIAAGTTAGIIGTHTTITGGMDGATGHTATTERKFF